MSQIIVNQSYATQRVTGQQRYAAEIAERLVPADGFAASRPTGFWASSALRAWAWVMFVLPMIARGKTLLSMTFRAPIWSRRQVVVVHDLFVLDHPEWFSKKYVWTHAPLLRLQIKRAAAVIAVSAPVSAAVSAMRPGEVPVATNAPSLVFFERGAEASTVLTEAAVEPGSYFLAVGSKDPRKNLGRLALAYAELSDDERRRHPLILVGGSAAIYRDEQISWPSGTVDAGYVDDAELRRLYRDARAVVFVSLDEGFGLPLVEAAAAGATSFLVSDIGIFRWICEDQARYVDPLSVAAIADGLRAEITDASHHSLNLSRFDWDASADVVRSTCYRVAGARRR